MLLLVVVVVVLLLLWRVLTVRHGGFRRCRTDADRSAQRDGDVVGAAVRGAGPGLERGGGAGLLHLARGLSERTLLRHTLDVVRQPTSSVRPLVLPCHTPCF